MKVTLKKTHTHADQSHPVGAKIEVAPHDALWLHSNDLIEESLDSIKAEVKKLATTQNPAPHAELLANAVAAEAARKTPTSAPDVTIKEAK